MAQPGFPLQILGRELLVPLRISVSWRCPCPGYVGLVLLPTREAGILARIGLAPTVPAISREVGPDDGRARWLDAGGGSPPAARPDGPRCWRDPVAAGYSTVDANDVPGLLSSYVAAAGDTEPNGQVRGQWRGRLLLTEEGPVVALTRKAAAYAKLLAWSDPQTGKWTFSVQRLGRWYSPEVKAPEKVEPTLREAIHSGFAVVEQLVADACTRRDTGRRFAYDPAWAAEHPRAAGGPAPAPRVLAGAEKAAGRAGKGKGRARRPKLPGVREATAALEAAVAARRPGPVQAILQPQADGTWAVGVEGREIARFATREGAERALRGRRLKHDRELPTGEQLWTGGRAPKSPDRADGTTRRTRSGAAIRQAPEGVPEAPQAPEPAPQTKAEVRRLADEIVKLGSWEAQIAGVDASLALDRARRLLRRADALIRSPLCRGPEREDAVKALTAGRLAYGQARKGIASTAFQFHQGQLPEDYTTVPALRALRRAAERAGLATARAAAACGLGQLTFPRAVAPPARPAAPPAPPEFTPAEQSDWPAEPPPPRKRGPRKRGTDAAPALPPSADVDARLTALFKAALSGMA